MSCAKSNLSHDENDLVLHSASVDQRNYRTFIEANLQNKAAAIIKDMGITAAVYKLGTKESVYQYTASDMRMVPSTSQIVQIIYS